MKEYQSLAHTRWDCKYHIVFIPKGRKKAIFGAIRKHLGEMLQELSRQKECKIVEGHLMPDHVHIRIRIPPKHAVSYVVGLYQGQECDRDSEAIRGTQQEFHWGEFLGTRVFRLYGRFR